MGYTDEELSYIYDKNNGYCWHCGKKLAFTNYGCCGRKGAWEVDHSNPVSKGGTDYFRNLVPACVECNRSKGDRRRAG
jgi:5-methylcytosine-specific restriction endonuclease McrA